jgi:hypothetical protein
MDTAQENQMETTNIHRNADQSALYENVRLSFTPSFFSHGWEYSLSPISEFPNTHMDTAGDFRLTFVDIKQVCSTLWSQMKKAEGMNSFSAAVTRLFL